MHFGGSELYVDKVYVDSILLKFIRRTSNMKAENKAWCEDLINFIKIFKWEIVRKEVPHRWKLTLGLTFNVIKGVQCFLRKSSQKSHPFYSFYFTCLREELRENISYSSKRRLVSPCISFSYFQERGCHCFLLGLERMICNFSFP